MALCGALCVIANTVTGFTNKSLRGLVAGLLGTDYSANQMTYDLRRLRLHGLIERIPGTIRYQLTPEGTRTVVFYTKLRDRLLGPLLNAGHQPPTPIELRRALKQIDRSLTGYITDARLDTAA
jgi:predicted MarR family transcription regulator